MIVLHAPNPLLQEPQGLAMDDGVLCLLVPDGTAPGTLAEAAPGAGPDRPRFIFDLVGAQSSQLDVLRRVILRVDSLTGIGSGPLIFLGPGAALPAWPIRKAQAQWSLDAQGELNLLICGPQITASALFLTFFRNMEPGMNRSHTPASLKIFDQHFGGPDA